MRPSPERSAIVPFTWETRMAPSPLEARTFAAWGTETTRRALRDGTSPSCVERRFHLDDHAIAVLAALNLDGRRSGRVSRVFFDDDHHFRPIPRLNLDGAVEGGQDDFRGAFDVESLLIALGDPPGISPGDDTAGKWHAQRQAR